MTGDWKHAAFLGHHSVVKHHLIERRHPCNAVWQADENSADCACGKRSARVKARMQLLCTVLHTPDAAFSVLEQFSVLKG
jgi:hypothetical protein